MPFFTTRFNTMNSEYWIFIYFQQWIHNMHSCRNHVNEIRFMNSNWIQWIFVSEFRIHVNEIRYINSDWIHNSDWMYSFHIWIHMYMNHIIISNMNSYNDYMNSYVNKFTYMNSDHMNSYKLWMRMIFSYMNSWNRVYQGSRCRGFNLILLDTETYWKAQTQVGITWN